MILHQLNGKEVVVNFNNVTSAYKISREYEDDYTEIDFINEDYVNVQESLSEIEQKLGVKKYIDEMELMRKVIDDEEAEILAARKGEE